MNLPGQGQDLFEASAGPGRNRQDGHMPAKGQCFGYVFFEGGQGGGRYQVTFVDQNHEGSLACVQHVHEPFVLLADAFGGVQGEQGHVGLGAGFDGRVDRIFFHAVRDSGTAAYSGGVHKDVILPVAPEAHVHAVACGAGHVGDDHPFFPGQSVDQGGLARVGPSQHG